MSDAKTRKAFVIRGADGEPIEIAHGEYYFNTKARGRRMWLDSLSSEARQVYAVLEMATMGFRQELAVKKVGGNLVPITPGDVAQRSKLSRQTVRRAMAELKDAGLADRKSVDGGPLRKGKVELYSWAVPRAPQKEDGSQDCSRALTTIPDWFPETKGPLTSLVKQLKYYLAPTLGDARDSFLRRLEEAARDYQESRNVVIALFQEVRAEPKTTAHKERTDRTSERKGEGSSSSVLSSPAAVPTPPIPEATTTNPTPSTDPTLTAIAEVADALSEYVTPDDDSARELYNGCRQMAPDATTSEIKHFIAERWPHVRHKRNPLRVLVVAVPKCFQPASIALYRARQRDYAQPRAMAAGAEMSAAEREQQRKQAAVRELRKGEEYEKD